MALYEKIAELREKQGLSQSELERKAQLSKGTITNWKKRTPNTKNLEKVAIVLKCDVSYLLSDNDHDEYYLDRETSKLAQEMFEDADMRSLFDMKKSMEPERFKTHMDFMKKLYEEEKKLK